MEFAEAWRLFENARRDEIDRRRAALVREAEGRCQEYEEFIVPPRPRGLLRWMLAGDYERCCYEREKLSERYETARSALQKFDSNVARREEQLTNEIRQRAAALCDARDRSIMGAIRKESRRRLEEQRLRALLKHLNDETGEEYRLPELSEGRFKKHLAVLIGRVMFDGSAYAKTTPDRGRSFDLYPWESEMQQHIGRACWFWFDRKECSHFDPEVGVRGPVILGIQPLVLPPPDSKGEDGKPGSGKA